MNSKTWCLSFAIGVGLILAACGPSPQEIAAMTAAAATSTPSPTSTPQPTATPMPHLNITVTDADGQPVAGASVTLADFGSDALVLQTDTSGKAASAGLPSENGKLSVAAQGYKPVEQPADIKPGSNEMSVQLERDPAGLLASDACAPGEKLLYAEDFQDGSAKGWNEIEYQAQGWTLGPDTEQPENIVATAQRTGEGGLYGTLQNDMTFDNAVWRLRFKEVGTGPISFNWRQSGNYDVDGMHVDDSRYQIVMAPERSGEIHRLQLPTLNIVGATGKSVKAGQWHSVEISTFDGLTEIWVDGVKWAAYTDPKPVPAGTISLEVFPFVSDQTVFSFDNLSVCELSAAFAPMPTPVPAS